MINGQLVVAYHGCDITTRDELVSGRIRLLDHSTNRYDWLGPGAYFFEGDVKRALMFATASQQHPDRMYTSRPIATPAVVGAVLSVGRWLDMTKQSGIEEFALAHEAMLQALNNSGHPVPVNSAIGSDGVIHRALDNAVFTFLHEVRKKQALPEFHAVRGAFRQGSEIALNSGFHRESHVQIAVRDNNCILGWFLPPGVPFLSAEERQSAEQRLAGIGNRKPRQRVKVA